MQAPTSSMSTPQLLTPPSTKVKKLIVGKQPFFALLKVKRLITLRLVEKYLQFLCVLIVELCVRIVTTSLCVSGEQVFSRGARASRGAPVVDQL